MSGEGPQPGTVDDLVIHRERLVGGLRMHVTEAGSGPLVVLLHGFPDFWYSWRGQIPALVAAGYRVLAPDLRGYAGTEAPRGVDRYDLRYLVEDVVGLIADAGDERATLVGHDWGGIVAWAAAAAHPAVIERLVVCNSPHPEAFQRGLRTIEQPLRSWYTGVFMLPVLPELGLGAHNGWLLRRVLRAGARRPGAFTDADLDRYVDALLRRGQLTGPLDYYRAAGRRLFVRRGPRGREGREERFEGPVLVLWGERDAALASRSATPPPELVPDARVVRFPDAGHFVHLDAPEGVNAELLRFLSTT